MDEEEGGGGGGGGSPAWMATFADLMSLLMCFFVLLLAFSEMDLQKYKQVAGSMREAFGVQREVFAKESPMGTSFVAREFSPGKPSSSPLTIATQATAPTMQRWLDVEKEGKPQGDTGAGQGAAAALGEKNEDGKNAGTVGTSMAEGLEGTTAKQKYIAELIEQSAEESAELDAEMIQEEMEDEMDEGLIDIIREGRKIIIRIQEKGSFAQGTDKIQEPFGFVLAKVARVLETVEGRIVVAGHTDNIPVRGNKFRSNWDLSSARAVSVVHKLLQEGVIEEKRMTVQGMGGNDPLANNESPEGRALNRRVEITVVKGRDIELDDDQF